jgi:cysteine-rich repeat protein
VSVIDTAGGGSLSDSLSAGSWSGIGNPPGIKGYKYSNAGAPGGGPVKLIILKGTVIKILAKDDGTLDGPIDGNVGIILSTGTAPDRYCAQFGGTDIKNDPGLVKRKDAPAPGGCPVVTPPTTTTTIPSGPVCGNGMVESPETCDDGNTVNADGCPADCIVDPCSQTPNPGGVLTVNMVNNESGQTTFGVVTVFIDYPEGKVLVPGTADDSQVQAAVTDRPTTGSPTCLPNDRDHGLQFGCLSTNGFNEGLFFRINHTDCASVGPPALGEFNCQVLEATDPIGFPVSATCTLSYAP